MITLKKLRQKLEIYMTDSLEKKNSRQKKKLIIGFMLLLLVTSLFTLGYSIYQIGINNGKNATGNIKKIQVINPHNSIPYGKE